MHSVSNSVIAARASCEGLEQELQVRCPHAVLHFRIDPWFIACKWSLDRLRCRSELKFLKLFWPKILRRCPEYWIPREVRLCTLICIKCFIVASTPAEGGACTKCFTLLKAAGKFSSANWKTCALCYRQLCSSCAKAFKLTFSSTEVLSPTVCETCSRVGKSFCGIRKS